MSTALDIRDEQFETLLGSRRGTGIARPDEQHATVTVRFANAHDEPETLTAELSIDKRTGHHRVALRTREEPAASERRQREGLVRDCPLGELMAERSRYENAAGYLNLNPKVEHGKTVGCLVPAGAARELFAGIDRALRR